jgi:antitoxin component YwqK of YwqJK toxin-antitoxin module
MQWYPNGNLRLEGRYVNDMKDGLFRYYDTSSMLLGESNYINGLLIK